MKQFAVPFQQNGKPGAKVRVKIGSDRSVSSRVQRACRSAACQWHLADRAASFGAGRVVTRVRCRATNHDADWPTMSPTENVHRCLNGEGKLHQE